MSQLNIRKFCHGATAVPMLCLAAMLMAAPAVSPAAAATQQHQTEGQVTGLVTDQQNQPLIGVTVSVVGSETRAITDVDGMFRIMAPTKASTELEFSYMGFKKKVVRVNGAKLLNVQMEEEANEFQEVVAFSQAFAHADHPPCCTGCRIPPDAGTIHLDLLRTGRRGERPGPWLLLTWLPGAEPSLAPRRATHHDPVGPLLLRVSLLVWRHG